MALFNCKMCGGSMDIDQNTKVCICQYCGTRQTLPSIGDDRKAGLYDRANSLRRNNEYDKAEAVYEQILNENPNDAESYWSLVLCTYGIEYVEDSVSHKIIPTVNRTQYTSILADPNYKLALKYADEEQRIVYEAEAKEIEQIQRGILEVSQKEEKFDIFICYKESDNYGRRTEDSVLANELYHQLTQEGFKVFFSRITLEDKLGSAYEPYIFAALNSAKVMVVIGTKPEYFNAVWVRNEWSRYLALIKKGEKKTLIPAYKDMNPYDLPEEFSNLQAQDMSKLGFVQDLIRGIKKITGTTESNVINTEKQQSLHDGQSEIYIKRGFMALEDGNFSGANDFFEQALNQNPENAKAYVGKLMVDNKVCNMEDLGHCKKNFQEDINYKRAISFADAELKEELEKYNDICCNEIYESALEKMKLAKQEKKTDNAIKIYRDVLSEFEKIQEWKDSDEIINIINSEINKFQTKDIIVGWIQLVLIIIFLIVIFISFNI